MALQRDPKNADIALILEMHIVKKIRDRAVAEHMKIQIGSTDQSNFAYPYVRIAKLFETQKQWDLVLENLNKAIQVDPISAWHIMNCFITISKPKYDEAQLPLTSIQQQGKEKILLKMIICNLNFAGLRKIMTVL
jgi:lipopolysaccharide biosynthesis regulator YciM